MTDKAAMGYAKLAGKDLGLSKAELEQLTELMRRRMDEQTEYEAEKAYQTN